MVRIACDVDDVLFEFYLMLALSHNERYGTNLRKEDFTSYLVHEVWQVPPKEAIRRVWEFYGTDEFRYLPLVDGAHSSIRRLAEQYELIAITGRPHGVASITEESLNRHFEGCFKEIHHTDAFGIGGGVPQSKVHICAEVGAVVMIEDYLGHATRCANAGIHVILFDQPWNRTQIIFSGRIDRVHSWSEALALLL